MKRLIRFALTAAILLLLAGCTVIYALPESSPTPSASTAPSPTPKMVDYEDVVSGKEVMYTTQIDKVSINWDLMPITAKIIDNGDGTVCIDLLSYQQYGENVIVAAQAAFKKAEKNSPSYGE